LKTYSEEERNSIRGIVSDYLRKMEGDKPLCYAWSWTPIGEETLKRVGHPEAVCYTDLGWDLKVAVYLDGLKPRIEKVH